MCKFLSNWKKVTASMLTLCLLLSGCGAGEAGQGKMPGNVGQENQDSQQVKANASQAGAEASEADTESPQQKTDQKKLTGGSLRLLNDRQMSFMTPEGYYYITEESAELSPGFSKKVSSIWKETSGPPAQIGRSGKSL